MVPALAPGDAVLDRPASSGVRPGDVVTFAVRSGPDLVVTHRAMSVTGDLITTKGDANETADPWTVRTQHVVGVPQLTLPRVGYVLVFLQQPQGALALLTSGLALIMLWQLFFAADDRHLSGSELRDTGTSGAGGLLVALRAEEPGEQCPGDEGIGQQRVEPVQDAAVTGQQRAHVLDAEVALERGLARSPTVAVPRARARPPAPATPRLAGRHVIAPATAQQPRAGETLP